MLFRTSHTPASRAWPPRLAATAAMLIAAGAARRMPWSVGRVSVAKRAVYTGGAFACGRSQPRFSAPSS